MRRALTAIGMAFVVLAGCGTDRGTVEAVRNAIADYRAAPSDAAAAEVEARFARLDVEIAERRAELARADDADDRAEAQASLEALERARGELRADYVSARMQAVGTAAGDALKEVGRSIGEGIEEAGRKLREAAGGTPAGEP